MFFYFIFIYIFLTYFFAFTYGFLVQELHYSIILVFFWPLYLLLYPIGGTIFFTFTCGKNCMLGLKNKEETTPPIKKEETFWEEVEIIVDDFGPLQFFILRREVV